MLIMGCETLKIKKSVFKYPVCLIVYMIYENLITHLGIETVNLIIINSNVKLKWYKLTFWKAYC